MILRPRFSLAFIAVIFTLVAFLACGEDSAPSLEADSDSLEFAEESEETETQLEAFSIAVISDSHVQLSNDSDQNRHFVEAAEAINPFGPDFIVNTGDLVDDLFCFPDINCSDPLPILTTYRDLIESSYDVPLYNVIGNHDNRYFDTFETRERPAYSWDTVFGDTPVPSLSLLRHGAQRDSVPDARRNRPRRGSRHQRRPILRAGSTRLDTRAAEKRTSHLDVLASFYRSARNYSPGC